MFGKFLKPKWQHPRPETRKQALLALDENGTETAKIFIQVAREDEDASLRSLAVKRLYDLGVLRQVMEADSDAGVQDQAARRYGRLLSGREPGLELSTRLKTLSGETDTRILELIARQGEEVALRLAALEKIVRESLLGDLAIEDPEAQVRLAAAERLTQTSTMKRVARHSRSRDKQVYSLVQGQLNRIQEAREMPERLQKEARSVCGQMETLSKARDMASTVAQKQGLEGRWQEIHEQWQQGKCGEFPKDLQERYQLARETYKGVYQQYLAEDSERQEQEKSWRLVREARQGLIDELRQGLEQLQGGHSPGLNQYRDMLHRTQQHWEQQASLPILEQQKMVNEYRHAREALAEAISREEMRGEIEENIQRLQKDVDRQASAPQVNAGKLKELFQRFDTLRKQGEALFPDPCRKLRSRLDSLQERHRQQERKRQEDQDRYRSLVPKMERHLADGKTEQAINALQELRAILRRLPAADRKALPEDLQQRFGIVAAELDNIRDWKRWSGTSHKEELVEEMEKLAREVEENPDARYDLNALAAQVRAAREEWKKLGEADREVTDELWERFNQACSRAYTPCGEYFQQQEQERQSHRRQKEVICNGLEVYYREKLQNIDPAEVDWQTLEKIISVAQDEWRGAGAVNRKDSKALNKRFYAALDRLRDCLRARRDTAADDKKQLIESMRRLLEQAADLSGDSPEFLHLLEDAKHLQVRWKEIGRANGDHKLWKKFRGLNDELFGRRTAHLEAEKESQVFHLEQKNEIIAEIDALAERPPEEFVMARSRYQDLRKHWKKLGPVPSARVRDLDKRYHRACRKFEDSEERAAQALQRRQLDILEDKAGLCVALESMAATGDNGDFRQSVERMQQQWQQLPSADDELEPVVQKRFQNAVSALLKLADGNDAAVQALLAEREHSATEHGELCLRMEILADVESPEDLREQRLEYQLSHLAERMRGDNRSDEQEFLDILYRWYRLPVFAEETRNRERFLNARNHYLDKSRNAENQ